MKKDILKNLVAKEIGDISFAEKLIRSGKVMVNNEIIMMPNQKVLLDAKIIIKETKKWVSRGAFKLIKAIEVFELNFKDKIVLDIGASKGGFTQVALKNGAKKVYALDVGTNQLDYSLRIDPSVVVYEKTNLKNIEKNFFAESLDLVVCDVSFIGLKSVFEVLNKILDSNKQVLVLIKPQFEASSKYVADGGFVEIQYHQFLIDRVVNQANDLRFKLLAITESPIKGNKSKNIEYLALFERN
ncbi:TlyA family RNA methyltransferase [Candidatus Mycoplasma pogonae]